MIKITLLALAPTAALPITLLEVDGDRTADTVAEYLDTTVAAWRAADPAWVGPGTIEIPGPGEVLVMLVPRAGEDQSTGVPELPPAQPDPQPTIAPESWCGRFWSWTKGDR